MKPSLCLNMIVKNEGARMERALNSVLPHVKAVAILDTGSTDDTIAVIERLCKQHHVYYVVGVGEFVDYSQARNDAFTLAKEHNVGDAWCQFALMMDADMELVVNNPRPLYFLNANATSYDMIQKGGALSYHNRRLVNLDVGKDAPYVGVTHEYIDLPCNGVVDATDVFFVDHADGANRPAKYERDVKLLEQGLRDEPDNARYLFYLGNTYHEYGQHELAVAAYDKHIAASGWDEEIHQAKMNRAKSLRELDDEAGFVTGMLDAYQYRPRRAEPLYELAKHYREKDKPQLALLYAARWRDIKRPDDFLFVNDYVYKHGLKYEYAIAGYYDERHRDAAFWATDALAIDPTFNQVERWAARSNLWWFLKPLKEYCPSFTDHRLPSLVVGGDESYTAMNPSVCLHQGKLLCNLRMVNYKIDEQGRYMIGPKECNDAPIKTLNFIGELTDALQFKSHPLPVVWERTMKWDMVQGLEDIRLQSREGRLWFNACVREQSESGNCDQWEGELLPWNHSYQVWQPSALADGNVPEKNWMPLQGTPDYLYRLDRVWAEGQLTRHETPFHVDNISGGSQAIPFALHGHSGWLAVVHEASTDPTLGKRTYWHRFAWLNHEYKLGWLSTPFVFLEKQIEFCAGLACHPDGVHLVLSYGVRDAEAHLCTVRTDEIEHMAGVYNED